MEPFSAWILISFSEMCLGIEALSCLRRDASSLLDPMECTDTAEEQRVHSPPASLVPRIHVVLAQKLQHINPLLPACLNKEESKTCKCKCWRRGAQTVSPCVCRELPVTCAHGGAELVRSSLLRLSFSSNHPFSAPFSSVLILLIKMKQTKVYRLSYFEDWHHLMTNNLSLH